jgi:hypothetical protein
VNVFVLDRLKSLGVIRKNVVGEIIPLLLPDACVLVPGTSRKYKAK